MLCPHLSKPPVIQLQPRKLVTAHARQQQQHQHGSRPADAVGAAFDDAHPIAKRRRLAFTQQPPADQQLQQQGPQQRHASKLQQQQQQQHNALARQHHQTRAPRWQPLPPPEQLNVQPDPAADDIDALAAAAAAVRASRPGGAGSSDVVLLGPVLNIPEAPASRFVPPAVPPQTSSYRAADKLRLSREEAGDIAARLRRAGRPPPGQPLLRVFRYGIDDLRLFKALELAGLEGRVVVVDTARAADAVLTARSKRTGKNVDLSVARRTAAAAGVPLLLLRAVSPQRVLEALGPLLGLQEVPLGQQLGQQGADSGDQLGLVVRGLGAQPRFLRWDETEGDGSEELLQLLWGPAAQRRRGSDEAQANEPDAAAVAAAAAGVDRSARWRAWRACQGAAAAEVRLLLGAEDVEQLRDDLVPANPTARVGRRYRLLKPLRHFSRIRRQRLVRHLRLKHVSW